MEYMYSALEIELIIHPELQNSQSTFVMRHILIGVMMSSYMVPQIVPPIADLVTFFKRARVRAGVKMKVPEVSNQ